MPRPIAATFRIRQRFPRWLRMLCTAIALGCLPFGTQAQGLEYRVKAAFIFNFAKFVEWPPEVLPDQVPLRIAVWAPEHAFGAIADALAGKEVAGHPIAVFPYDPASAPPHVLFVHSGAEPLAAELLEHLSRHSVLLVGESPEFASRYGTIGLVPRGDTLRFQINLAAAHRARLNLSGQLARLAEVVKDQP